MGGGGEDRRRVGSQGLDDHPSARLTATAAPGELRDEREGALLGAEVGKAQARIGVEQDAEDDGAEVVALGDHLGADEDAALGGVEGAEHPGVGALRARRVGVEPEDGQRIDELAQQSPRAARSRRRGGRG